MNWKPRIRNCNGFARSSRSSTWRSRMYCTENYRAVREAGGDRALGGGARAHCDSGVQGVAMVADGLLRASAAARTARRRFDSGVAGVRRTERSLGILEVRRPVAPRRGVAESQACASRVLRAVTVNVIDEGNQDALTSVRVTVLPDELIAQHCTPRAIRCDDGPEFTSSALRHGGRRAGLPCSASNRASRRRMR